MMNIPGSAGESSSKRQENGDASNSSERPLKKARFAWQVKGKYHLKNEISDSTKSSVEIINDSERAGSSTENESASKDLVGNTEQNLEILGDYLLKQDFNTLDSVITDPDKSLLKPNTNLSNDKLQYPRYVSTQESNAFRNSFSRTIESDKDVSLPISMVISNDYVEDQCIARWQARQMAKGFVDNTINRVLDSWMVAPLPTDMDNNRFLALDVAEFINNLPGDNSIENEGILMAISAHGLQNTSTSSNASVENNNEQIGSSSNIKESFPSPSSSPVPSDDEIQIPNNNKPTDTDGSSSNDLDLSWPYGDDVKKDLNNELTPFHLFPETSSSSYPCFSENDRLSTNMEYDEENINGNHFDFLDAAVSFAIQNKGLTAFGTDYG